MKLTKKLTIGATVLTLAFALTACGNDKKDDTTSNQPATESQAPADDAAATTTDDAATTTTDDAAATTTDDAAATTTDDATAATDDAAATTTNGN